MGLPAGWLAKSSKFVNRSVGKYFDFLRKSIINLHSLTPTAYLSAKELRLIPSLIARPLYESLDFTHVNDWGATPMFRPGGSSTTKRGRAQVATGALAEAALLFEASEDCSNRSPGSLMPLFSDTLCVVIECDSGNAIEAATWMHLAHDDKLSGKYCVWIAPVIARSTSLARELIAGAIAIWEERNPAYTSCEVQCMAVQSESIFTSLGFKTIFSTCLMRRSLGSSQLPSFPPPSPTYFAFAGWHGT